MLAGIVQRNRSFWTSREFGFRALSWSIRTKGLLDSRLGWSSYLVVLWVMLSPYKSAH